MRKIFYLILFAFLFQSCSVLYNHEGANALSHKRVLVELEIDDIQLLGESEVTYEYSRSYFPFLIFPIDRIISINGEKPDNGNKHFVDLPGLKLLFSPKMKRALYKTHVEFPEADYFDLKNRTVERHRMFLGLRIKRSATVKAYKYNYPRN